jgi:hypothetical protein
MYVFVSVCTQSGAMSVCLSASIQVLFDVGCGPVHRCRAAACFMCMHMFRQCPFVPGVHLLCLLCWLQPVYTCQASVQGCMVHPRMTSHAKCVCQPVREAAHDVLLYRGKRHSCVFSYTALCLLALFQLGGLLMMAKYTTIDTIA